MLVIHGKVTDQEKEKSDDLETTSMSSSTGKGTADIIDDICKEFFFSFRGLSLNHLKLYKMRRNTYSHADINDCEMRDTRNRTNRLKSRNKQNYIRGSNYPWERHESEISFGSDS